MQNTLNQPPTFTDEGAKKLGYKDAAEWAFYWRRANKGRAPSQPSQPTKPAPAPAKPKPKEPSTNPLRRLLEALG